MSFGLLFLACALLAVIVAHMVRDRLPRHRRRRALRRLVKYCDGDAELAERLMLLEMERDPAAGFTEAAQRAIARLRRDRL